MRSRTANWFICNIRYDKTQEDGLRKKVAESYIVDAVSFGEAESRIIEEMAAYINGEYEVVDISRTAFSEIFFSDEETADKWYNAKLEFITIDEKTGKEKRSAVVYLVQAGTFDNALKNVNDVMDSTMIDYVTAKIEETKIIDVFEYVKKDDADSDEDL